MKGVIELYGVDEPKAWQDVFDSEPLAGRVEKPRTTGLTMLLDKGLGLAETRDLLELAADYIDVIKLTFGTSGLYPERLLREKIRLIRSYRVDICPGGTFLEVAILQGRLERFLQRADELGFTCIEVSDGTIDMQPALRRHCIQGACRHGFKVITEVGKKDSKSQITLLRMLQVVVDDLQHGASSVIIEGRESGKNVGIYDAEGRVKEEDLADLVSGIGNTDSIMWEAPLKNQQISLISHFGPNVNLGNIPPGEILAVEALRRGLRGDTLKLALERGLTVPSSHAEQLPAASGTPGREL